MDYKQTLLLPTTKFAMRGNLTQNEPKRYEKWHTSNVYAKMRELRKGAKEFTLHDGPPYANGHIHIGHALNKILKDIVIKQHYFAGEAVSFTPGWDCHGLPIEQQVEKKLGGKQKKELLKTHEVRELCREHAKKFVDIQSEEFRQLGIIADWDKPYLTMDYRFEADIYRTLCSVAASGLLIERSKPVFWSWAERTALAEAEVEYKDKEDYSIFVAFELSDESKIRLGISGDAAPVIWTTTPWTLPANVAISLNPDEIYVRSSDGYIVAQKLYDSLLEQGVVAGEIIQSFQAKEFDRLSAINPLNGRRSTLVLGEHVLVENGTGCVHTAPGHGEDDYRVGLKYELDVIMSVDERGCFDDGVVKQRLLPDPESFVGMHIFKANEPILQLLGKSLLKKDKFVHSYPHCWRSHKPLIFRATPQWFIAIDKRADGVDKTLREIAKDGVDNTLFYPETGRNRLSSMVENRPDWCISRQRDWGVPIAFFRVKATGEVLLDEKVLNFIAMIFQMRGSDAWYNLSIKELLYPGASYSADELEKVEDILDVWFDSGSTWSAVLKSRNYSSKQYPADVYLEGSDQHRGWFQSSLFLSSAIEQKAPYKAVITHGFTVDGNGEKMSKSKGNILAPKKILDQYGSEILRLWVVMCDYTNDQKISDAILKQTAEQYRKLRNTFRFLLANIDDLESVILYDQLGEVDKWIVSKASTVFDEAYGHFKNYNFVAGMSIVSNFIVNELSGIYLDITKDRLYCDSQNGSHRVSSQSAMCIVAKQLLTLIAPILTYTADEIVESSPKVLVGDCKTIFELQYSPLQVPYSTFDEQYMVSAREGFYEVVDQLKKSKSIKSTLELVLETDSKIVNELDRVESEDWFVVSGINSDSSRELGKFVVDGDEFIIKLASSHKCPRCWKFQAKSENELCGRCKEVVDA